MMNQVNVSRYAGSVENSPYDTLAKHNREYQRLLRYIGGIFATYAKDCTRVGDLACGTGNVTLAIYDALKSNPVVSIQSCDLNESMVSISTQKYQKLGLGTKLHCARKDLLDPASFDPETFDAINITHALNYTGQPKLALQNVHRWLAPQGVLVVTDIGRELDVTVWAKVIFQWICEDFRTQGQGPIAALVRTIRTITRSRAAGSENRRFQQGQKSGIYPMHSPEEFRRWVKEAGFEILHFNSDHYRDPRTCKGIDDLVVARKSLVGPAGRVLKLGGAEILKN